MHLTCAGSEKFIDGFPKLQENVAALGRNRGNSEELPKRLKSCGGWAIPPRAHLVCWEDRENAAGN